jgi:hypothetical protein
MNTDGTGFYTCKECHQTECLLNHITTDHKEGEQLEDQRNVGESSCNSGDGTDQRVQSFMFMMKMIIFYDYKIIVARYYPYARSNSSVGIATGYGLNGPGIE